MKKVVRVASFPHRGLKSALSDGVLIRPLVYPYLLLGLGLFLRTVVKYKE